MPDEEDSLLSTLLVFIVGLSCWFIIMFGMIYLLYRLSKPVHESQFVDEREGEVVI